MRRAGKNFRSVRFYREGATEKSSGEMVHGGADVEIAKSFAEVNYGAGSERRRAGAENSVVGATLRVLSTAATRAVKATDLADFDGATWNVTGAVPWGRKEIDITAVRRS